MTDSSWWVYIVRCADDTLYTGISNDVERRVSEHQSQGRKTARYLRGRAPLALVYTQQAGDYGAALRLEYRIKQLDRRAKLRLISGDESILTSLMEQADESSSG
ncbi:GIY-YIG nuclease family protein [Pseudohongiella spirulinae]|uniref:Nuclease n=1 Tax=Pseudohongiella spirulinae TaxID=1249552 RepID=A0A0S2KFR8_9GAMM|nr:GIY-YIG nuclease family protein [Pseudohongiella spirulinae]ALO46815.1 nuclease [Pseudohongiella spirulinae]